MFVRIDNTPRDYAWGSTTAIAELLGRTPSGGPEAELWLGAHTGSPARILDPAETGGAADLAQWIESDPADALGADAPSATEPPRLPFLLKVLAAAGPLSLQAHPSPEQACAGFDRENAAGLPLDAPNRNYKDPFHKPEMIFALSERFDALCGFRSLERALADVDLMISTGRDAGMRPRALLELRARLAHDGDPARILRGTVGWLLGGGEPVDELVVEVVDAATRVLETAAPAHALAFQTVQQLQDAYQGDPGVVISLLLNRVRLKAGEALYLPAGNIHAYLDGLGVELMASSDNVLRGGLTPKYIDVPELLRVLDFEPLPVPYLRPHHEAPGLDLFRPDVPDFELAHIVVGDDAAEATLPIAGPAIALCTDGETTLRGASGELTLARGEAVYVTPEEASITVSGTGTVFIATPNL
jgi:mannose-6-phosphate isomerase